MENGEQVEMVRIDLPLVQIEGRGLVHGDLGNAFRQRADSAWCPLPGRLRSEVHRLHPVFVRESGMLERVLNFDSPHSEMPKALNRIAKTGTE